MTTLGISDLHAPYHHPDALDFLADLKRRYKPSEVVCLGDEADLHRFSTHEHEADSLDARRELRGVRRFTVELAKLFPTLKLCTSNHIARLLKAANRANLPSSTIKRWSTIIQAPATWRWADKWAVNGATWIHGDGYSGVKSMVDMVLDYQTNVVAGHLHAVAGVTYVKREGLEAWGMASGSLANPKSPVQRYGKHNRMKSILSTSVIADGVPLIEVMK